MSSEATVAREKLAADLKQVVADTEELLRATAGQTEEKVRAARHRAEETMKGAKARLVEVEEAVVAEAKAAAKATDRYVHDNPWQAVGIAAGVSFLVGWLLANGRHR
jgi:ElaB/YqjD/DUF883 family membrane-anchored ribosome-binding protein